MDLQGNMQPESGKFEQIISQFLLKSLHIILDSRVPSLHSHDRSGDLSTSSRVKKREKWFNLALGDRPAVLDNLKIWHRNLMDPMIIDIVLVREGTSSSTETVIERWVIQYECPRILAPQTGDLTGSHKKAYQKSIVLLRSLYSQMRLLPAYRMFRQLSTSSHTCNFDIIYKLSSFSDPFSRAEEEMMEVYNFTAVEALSGRLCISVTYYTTLSDFNLEFSTPLPPKIITDYVGSPNTNPPMSFPAQETGVHATSIPLRGIRPLPSVPFERPHSWASGFHKAAPLVQNQTIIGSPPIFRPCHVPRDFPSPLTDKYGNRIHNYPILTRQRSTIYDEYQLLSPFSPSPSASPSLSPSPPTCFLSGNPMQNQLHSETAPVTIPRSGTGKGSRNISPDFSDASRNSLPPLSPRSTKNDNSMQESPSGIRPFRKIQASRAGDVHSTVANYGVQKIVKDNKDESGWFSGLLSSGGSPRIGFSRSFSRLSFQDDFDDGDFSYPFAVDDVDMLDVQPSQNVDDKSASKITSTALPKGGNSQDAAIGILVCMLRAARPLCQDPSCFSSHSLKTGTEGRVATASGVFVPRKMADALEELRIYREIRDLLLSKSETGVMSKDEA